MTGLWWEDDHLPRALLAGLASRRRRGARGPRRGAAAAAAFFSTIRTAMIEPSYRAAGYRERRLAEHVGGVRTAAMMKATTMK